VTRVAKDRGAPSIDSAKAMKAASVRAIRRTACRALLSLRALLLLVTDFQNCLTINKHRAECGNG
jgi:hypothetical protein